MWRSRYRFVIGMLPVLVLATGCQATGMGFIQSVDLVDKATFGFVFRADLSTGASSFSGSYHDPQGMTTPSGVVSVDFKGTGVLKKCQTGDPLCVKAPANAKGGCVEGEPQYESQNPDIPGGGTLLLIVCDLDGTGGAGADLIFIQVESGPYFPYTNTGVPQGNITVTQ